MNCSRLLIISCLFYLVACEPVNEPEADNYPPEAFLKISPAMGDTTTWFVLDGSRSRDYQGITELLKYRWDLNDDSAWDTDWVDYPYLIQAFTQPKTHIIRLEVKDRFGLTDTTSSRLWTYGINHDTSGFRDPRDGQYYKTVRINGLWWMAENLNYGVMIDDTATTRDNETPEKYCYMNNPDSMGSMGGYYTYYDWNELMNYDTLSVQGLCPPGWEIPTTDDWDSLFYPFTNKGLVTYFSEEGYSMLNLTCIGVHTLTKFWEPIDQSPYSRIWMYFSRSYKKEFYLGDYTICPFLASSSSTKAFLMRWVSDSVRLHGGALPVRCVKRQ